MRAYVCCLIVFTLLFPSLVCAANTEPMDESVTGGSQLTSTSDVAGAARTPFDVERSSKMASTYVPLNSWIYPAFDRLIALGYVRSGFVGIRPWTRLACLEMLEEAGSAIAADPNTEETARTIYESLVSEFDSRGGVLGASPRDVRFDSVYTRATQISGDPLNDSFHFGQTIVNDYGRPYRSGFNNVTGFTARAHAGRFSLYVNGEYQHAPSWSGYTSEIRELIAGLDRTMVQPYATGATNQWRLLDTYATVKLFGDEISFGKQSLWWGPSSGGPLLNSNNAEPMYMLRISRPIPVTLPWVFRYLGKMRYEAFFGKMSGHRHPRRPFIHGQKISLKPTNNLELGFSRNVIFAGEGYRPLTFSTFYKSFFSLGDHLGSSMAQFDPGDRKGGFDVSYRIPGLRKWLMLYADTYVDDDPSPLAAPPRAAISPGFYLSHFPNIEKLDFRAEAVYTDTPSGTSDGRFIYWNGNYRDGHTNKGNIIGNWIGRAGKGAQAWSTYWFRPDTSLQLAYRNAKISPKFLPGGGTQHDLSLSARVRINRDFEVQSALQYENWLIPVLEPKRKSDVAFSLQLTYWPKLSHGH
ncbi:MAG TPA: capsule assembly Wzi family protein [Terriglobales bacterium]|nr:capsule assembly Wzi family protein [Terriglobales bacterium]